MPYVPQANMPAPGPMQQAPAALGQAAPMSAQPTFRPQQRPAPQTGPVMGSDPRRMAYMEQALRNRGQMPNMPAPPRMPQTLPGVPAPGGAYTR